MVSIHRVPVDVLLIISVVCFIFRFKREAQHICSLHILRLLRIAHLVGNEQRQKPHADMYHKYSIPILCWHKYTPTTIRLIKHVETHHGAFTLLSF